MQRQQYDILVASTAQLTEWFQKFHHTLAVPYSPMCAASSDQMLRMVWHSLHADGQTRDDSSDHEIPTTFLQYYSIDVCDCILQGSNVLHTLAARTSCTHHTKASDPLTPAALLPRPPAYTACSEVATMYTRIHVGLLLVYRIGELVPPNCHRQQCH